MMSLPKDIRKIGISGGTFDPIHIGHLICAEHARQMFGLEKVVFIPTGLPPHKDLSQVTEPAHRYSMVKAAVSGNQFFEASDIEILRKGITYTYDTLTALKSIYHGCRLYFIIGADVLKDIGEWRNPEGIFALCEFIAFPRPGSSKKLFLQYIDRLRVTYGAIIHMVESTPVDVSSTGIRKMIREGMTIRYLVPSMVEQYIHAHHLYT